MEKTQQRLQKQCPQEQNHRRKKSVALRLLQIDADILLARNQHSTTRLSQKLLKVAPKSQQ
jgi:hypothetical protein